jgi:hypothetical protein
MGVDNGLRVFGFSRRNPLKLPMTKWEKSAQSTSDDQIARAIILDNGAFLFLVKSLTPNADHYGDAAAYVAYAEHLLALLAHAFGRVYCVLDGLAVDKEDEANKRVVVQQYQKQAVATALQSGELGGAPCRTLMPEHLSICLRKAINTWAELHSDVFTVMQAASEDECAARLSVQLGGAPVLSNDADYCFFRGCAFAPVALFRADVHAGTIELHVSTWADRCHRLGLNADPRSNFACHAMGALAVVLGNDRVSATALRGARGGLWPAELTLRGLSTWLANERRQHWREADPHSLLDAILDAAQADDRTRVRVERAARWYRLEEEQLAQELALLGQDRVPLLNALQSRQLSKDALLLAAKKELEFYCMLHPLLSQRTATTFTVARGARGVEWGAQPGPVRLDPLVRHLVISAGEFFRERNCLVAAAAIGAAEGSEGAAQVEINMADGVFSASLSAARDATPRLMSFGTTSLSMAALNVLARALQAGRVPEFGYNAAHDALARLVTLAAELPETPCSCMRPSTFLPGRVSKDFLRLHSSWACCLDILYKLHAYAPFEEVPSTEAQCVLYDPMALYYFLDGPRSRCRSFCERHSRRVQAVAIGADAFPDTPIAEWTFTPVEPPPDCSDWTFGHNRCRPTTFCERLRHNMARRPLCKFTQCYSDACTYRHDPPKAPRRQDAERRALCKFWPCFNARCLDRHEMPGERRRRPPPGNDA